MNRGTVAEIDLEAIAHNLRVVKDLSRNRPVIAVVKADAYGHGAIGVSRRLASDGVEYLAVAFTEEAKTLRDGGIAAPVLVLFDPDVSDVMIYNLTAVVASLRSARALSREAEKAHRQLPVHIKVDTGMGRLGLTGDAVREITEIAGLKGITIEGVMSHFSEADLSDASYAEIQIGKFRALQDELLNKGLKIRFYHFANSAAVMAFPESHFDAVRPGLMLYGYSPLEKSGVSQSAEGRTPESILIRAMTIKATLLAVRRVPAGTPISYGRTFITERESLIGLLSLGYADGFTRRFSNNGEVLIKGRRVPVVGRVCMDLTMVDVTGLEDVEEGDEVVIMGRQGHESIDAAELALRADTICYEILTSLGSRAKRLYVGTEAH